MKKKYFIHLIFLIVLAAGPIFSEQKGKKDPSGNEFILYETYRTLAVLPLANETGEERVDYLRTGIPKMMRSNLEEIGQVLVDDPEVRFVARPYPHKKNRKSYRKGKSRLPLKIRVVQMNGDMEELFRMSDSVKQAEYLNADYILSGNYSGDPVGILVLNLNLFDARKMQSRSFRYEFHVQNIYNSLGPVAESIKSEFVANEFATVTVRTPEDGAMVYLDDLYLGRTPVSKKIFPDSYTLYVEQDGYETHEERVVLQTGSAKEFNIQNKAVVNKGLLAVTSDPPGAEVYLDITRIGKTPLVRDDLPEGTHRVRISKEGYIDRYIGVQISDKKSASFKVTMKEGDTFRHFRDPHYVVLDWTYDDLSFSSLISSLFFYSGYWIYRAEADRNRDSLRIEYLTLLSALNIPELTLYEYYRLEMDNRKALNSMKNARMSAGGGIFMIALSAALLWRGLVLEGREAGEVLNKKSYSFFISPRVETNSAVRTSGFDFGVVSRF